MTDLKEVALLNSSTISQVADQFESIEKFLQADIILPFHSSNLSEPDETLKYEYDLDGLV